MHKTFLSCDWGTSSFRLRLIEISSAKILAESFSDEGIATTYAAWKSAGHNEKLRMEFYQSVIQKHIIKMEGAGSRLANIPIIISGMASSTIGMVELPYANLPFSLTGEGLQYKKIEKTGSFLHELVIISGVRNDTDVMRGEETQLIGCVNDVTDRQQIFIFTGTHSKHVTTTNGKAADLTTYMTGEFFDLLSTKSILSDSIEAGGEPGDHQNKSAFESGVKDSLQNNILHNAFMVRTNQLFKRFTKAANYFYLSGLLIGSELNVLNTKEINAITIVGDGKLVSNYLLALKILEVDNEILTFDASDATIQGQLKMYFQLYKKQ